MLDTGSYPSAILNMAANSEACVAYIIIKNFTDYEQINLFCLQRNIDHHNDYNHTERYHKTYFFTFKDIIYVLEFARRLNIETKLVNIIK